VSELVREDLLAVTPAMPEQVATGPVVDHDVSLGRYRIQYPRYAGFCTGTE
jgi:hypothetical protein